MSNQFSLWWKTKTNKVPIKVSKIPQGTGHFLIFCLFQFWCFLLIYFTHCKKDTVIFMYNTLEYTTKYKLYLRSHTGNKMSPLTYHQRNTNSSGITLVVLATRNNFSFTEILTRKERRKKGKRAEWTASKFRVPLGLELQNFVNEGVARLKILGHFGWDTNEGIRPLEATTNWRLARYKRDTVSVKKQPKPSREEVMTLIQLSSALLLWLQGFSSYSSTRRNLSLTRTCFYVVYT